MKDVKAKKVVKTRNFAQALYPKTSGKREQVFDYLKSEGLEKGGKLNWKVAYNVCSSLKVNQLFGKQEDGSVISLKKTDSPNGFARVIKEQGKAGNITEWEMEIQGDKDSRKVIVTL